MGLLTNALPACLPACRCSEETQRAREKSSGSQSLFSRSSVGVGSLLPQ